MHLVSILAAIPVLSILSLDLVPGVRASPVDVATSQDTCQLSGDYIPCKRSNQRDQNVGSSWQKRELATEGHIFQFTDDKNPETEADYAGILQRSAAVRGSQWKRSPGSGRRSDLASEEETNDDLTPEVNNKRSADPSYVRGANKRSAAVRGDRWKRSPVFRSNGRRSDFASEEETNDDFTPEVNNKRSADPSYVRGANRRSALAEPINRINGKRSADPTVRGPRSAEPINRINGKRSADPTVRGPRSAEPINRINGKRSVDSTQDSAQSDTSARLSSRDAQYYPGRIFGEKPFSYMRIIGHGVHSKRDPEPIDRSANGKRRVPINAHRPIWTNNGHARRSIWSEGIIEAV